MASTWTLQQIVTEIRAYPEVTPVLGVSGYTTQPALSIGNDTMQKMLAQGLDWKWNRGYVNVNNGVGGILTVALQQDYVTQHTDVGWLESAWRVDINNSTNNGNKAPKPILFMESVRDLPQTSAQSQPFQISFIPNSLAFMGQWNANTVYGCGYGVAQIPLTPLQQFIDQNGNILYLDSTTLGLSINSQGFANTPITLPTPNPYGTSGSTQPFAPPNAAPGTQVTDGTVTWTVANPDGYAMRIAPLPAFSGLAWLIIPVYQKKPPIIKTLGQSLAPLQDDVIYLYRQGFLAACYEHASSPKAGPAYEKWMMDMNTFLRSGDREREEAVLYPSDSLMGGSSSGYGLSVGPSWPFGGGSWGN